MKKIITTVILSFLSIVGYCQVSNNTVMVRVVETWGRLKISAYLEINAEILISFPDGRIRRIELHESGINNIHSNTLKIHETLDPFFSDEYELLSNQSTGGDFWSTHTWIFRKIETK